MPFRQMLPNPKYPSDWFLLPLEFRQRWWLETDYDKHDASDELKTEAMRLIENARNSPQTSTSSSSPTGDK